MINEMKQGKSGTQKGNGKKHNQKLGKMLSEYEKFNQALKSSFRHFLPSFFGG